LVDQTLAQIQSDEAQIHFAQTQLEYTSIARADLRAELA